MIDMEKLERLEKLCRRSRDFTCFMLGVVLTWLSLPLFGLVKF
jgi:hypothetical protein